MWTRYIWYLLWNHLLWARVLGEFVFPIAYIFRNKVSKEKGRFLWYHLADNSLYGDWIFKEKLKGWHGIWWFRQKEETFFKAFLWYNRNNLSNYRDTHKTLGDKVNYTGYETCQRDGCNYEWRTIRTTDEHKEPKFKSGKYIDFENAILGKQNISFIINDKKYFRKSRCTLHKLWGNRYWIKTYKFGFDRHFYDLQFQPFTFKRVLPEEMDKAGNLTYKRIIY